MSGRRESWCKGEMLLPRLVLHIATAVGATDGAVMVIPSITEICVQADNPYVHVSEL